MNIVNLYIYLIIKVFTIASNSKQSICANWHSYHKRSTIIMNTMPVAVLNGSLILINGIQLARILRKEREENEKKENLTNETDN